MSFLQPEIETVEVYPDVWDSFLVFDAMDTQWTHGYSGPVGLKYENIKDVCFFLGITGEEELKEVFQDLRVMENTALKAMAKKK